MDKAALQRMAAAMVAGVGLKFRPLAKELVIINPQKPENGQVRIEYATGYVSLKRTAWEHWGLLEGYQDDEGTDGPIGAAKLLSALYGTADQPAPPDPACAAIPAASAGEVRRGSADCP